MRRRYDLTNEEWNAIESFLPLNENIRKDRRHRLNAVLWVAQSGAAWRDLPDYYGPWSFAYSFFWRLQKSGTWEKILEHVAIEPDFEKSCWIRQLFGFISMERAQKGQHKQAIGRFRGGLTTKIHAVVDALGNPLKFELTPGQAHDCVQGYEMLAQFRPVKP